MMPRKAEIQVDLGPVHCELDISIVDRLNSLLQPQKLATTELIPHLYTSYNKHVSLVSDFQKQVVKIGQNSFLNVVWKSAKEENYIQ